MKLVKQDFEILEQKDFTLKGIKQFIERCGRVCYKSEDRITDTSYEKFVNMLESRDHSRPLEFGTVRLRVPEDDWLDIVNSDDNRDVINPMWIKYRYYGGDYFVTTNYRLYKGKEWLFKPYLDELNSEYYPKRYTVHMILSRGVMDEFRTHVGLSHLAESTRYCNYSKDKFDNQVTFIIPSWLAIPEGSIEIGNYDKTSVKYEDGNIYTVDNKPPYVGVDFIRNLCETEICYLSMIKGGWVPQQAREILPLCVKSELISCGFADAWANFFYRRCAPDAHPMAREIAVPMQEKFKELCYIGYVNK